MRSTFSPTGIAITGAGRGLGAALALELSAPGRHLTLTARTTADLDAVARRCRDQGAEVTVRALDVADSLAVRDWLESVDRVASLDLVIANAGIFVGRPHDKLFEDPATATRAVRTNLEGAMHTAMSAAELMQPRRRGQIALITSLAALHPLADAISYSASKAGLQAFGEALREQVAGHGIAVSLVMPGHIETWQTKRQNGQLPLMLTPQDAAKRIVKGLAAGRSEIAFPGPMYLLVKAGRLVPWRVRAWLGRSQRFHVDPVGPPD